MTDGSVANANARNQWFYNQIIGDWLNFQLLISGGLILFGVAYGLAIATPYDVQIVTLTVVFAIIGVGWSIAAGLAGQLLIGYISFFGLGAYVNAILLTKFGISPGSISVLEPLSARWLQRSRRASVSALASMRTILGSSRSHCLRF